MTPALELFGQDVRYALRGLARNPGFSFTAILAAALGIGAATAVFSAVDRVLFRPLPYPDEERLVSVGMMAPLDSNEFLLAEPYIAMRHDLGPFESVTAFQAGAIAADLTEGNPLRLRAMRIEANFLDVFGMRPAAGRSFRREEDRPNGPPVAMISYGLWQSRFAGDPRVVGRTLALDGAPVRIAGVLPRTFTMPTGADCDIALPLALNEATERAGRAFRVFARLKPGVTVAQAYAELEPGFRRALLTVPPQFRKEVSLRVRTVRDRQMGDARAASFALFGAVLAVMLIACANIASLLTARAVAREREIAVRAALGASRWRIARQVLTESLLVGLAGAACGCALAALLLRVFVSLAPAALPGLENATIDGRVLIFALCAALGSSALFGFAPALRRPAALAIGSRATDSRGGLRAALVSLEIAFSMILLTGAALLLQSLWKLESAPLGIDSNHVVTARFVLGRERYGTPERLLAFFNELEQRLSAAPGIEAAAISDTLPPSGGMRARPFATIDIDGRPRMPEGTGGMVGWRYVTPGYFAALSVPIARGRAFAERDRAPSAYTVILSESLAGKLFPHEDPIGRSILKGPQGQWSTVIGVARDVTNIGAVRESGPEFYIVRKHGADFNFQNQEPPTGWRSAAIVARTAVNTTLAASSIRSILAEIAPGLPVEMETMQQRVRGIDQGPRFYALLLSAFAAIGVSIAAVGLFGVVMFLVTRRTREIGIRMALGATPGGILRMTLSSAGRWTVAGLALGALGSLAAARVLRSLLFHVDPGDPGAFAGAAALLCVVALGAAAIPARRAAALDPNRALREE